MIPIIIQKKTSAVFSLEERHIHKNEDGQSLIEFILTFAFALGFIFLFIKTAMNYTEGYIVHHATFMASRQYLVADTERTDIAQGDEGAFNLAKEVFKFYLNGLAPSASNGEIKVNHPLKDRFPFYTGIWFKYVTKFSIGLVGGSGNLDFRSESLLGREPTRQEVYEQICSVFKSVGNINECNNDFYLTLDDNGG